MTEIQLVNEGIEVWTWLVDNFPSHKKEYPPGGYTNDCDCKLCSLFISLPCSKCCLLSCNVDSDFGIWYDFVNHGLGVEAVALQSAKNVLERLEDRKTELENE